MIELSNTDLLLRLTNFEDHFVERKTHGDSKDWLKTVVGFANSVPIGYPAVLFIGIRDNGEIEENVNLDTLQKTLGKKLAETYPPIYYLPKVLSANGLQFLAVIVPGSESRPHFAGPSYIRSGSETKVASESQFQELIAQRQSKAYEILKWKFHPVTVDIYRHFSSPLVGPIESSPIMQILDCTQFYVILNSGGSSVSYPLNRIELSFDHGNNRLKLEIRPQ